MTRPELTDVRGIGPKTAERLVAHGLRSVRALAEARKKTIAEVPGFDIRRARTVRHAARVALATVETQAPSKAPAAGVGPGKRTTAAKDAKGREGKKGKKEKKSTKNKKKTKKKKTQKKRNTNHTTKEKDGKRSK